MLPRPFPPALSPKPQASRRAFTLVELLIAMVLTLILVTAIAQFYAIIGESVKDSRAMIEVSGRVRAAVNRLNEDLENITCQVAPWTDDGSDGGYFEYFEGAANDYDWKGMGRVDASYDGNSNGIYDAFENGITTALGDGDDYLAFTIRSLGRPLTGRYVAALGNTPSIYSSEYAEVIWWVGWDDLPTPGNSANNWDYDEPKYLYRRQLLIRPDLPRITVTPPTRSQADTTLRQLWQESDVSMSVRYNSTTNEYYIQPNSLADLSRREHRFAHDPITGSVTGGVVQDSTFPHTTLNRLLPSPSLKTATTTTSPVLQAPNGNPAESPGEDVMLSNVLAFDVQIYDPYVRVWSDNNGVAPVLPSDPGYRNKTVANMTPANLVGLGGFVDLYYYRSLPSYFSNPTTGVDVTLANSYGYPKPLFAAAPSNSGPINTLTTIGSLYDTWALSYERDGIDQIPPSSGGDNTYDLATNGADDTTLFGPANGLVDDVAERETTPPPMPTPSAVSAFASASMNPAPAKSARPPSPPTSSLSSGFAKRTAMIGQC